MGSVYLWPFKRQLMWRLIGHSSIRSSRCHCVLVNHSRKQFESRVFNRCSKSVTYNRGCERLINVKLSQKSWFSSNGDSLGNDELVKSWMKEIRDDFEKEKKTTKTQQNDQKKGINDKRGKVDSDIENVEKVGFTTEEYMAVLKGYSKRPDIGPLSSQSQSGDDLTVTEETSDSDCDNDNRKDGKTNSSDNESNKLSSDNKSNEPKNSDKSHSQMADFNEILKKSVTDLDDEEWAVVVLDYDDDNDDDNYNPADGNTKTKLVDFSQRESDDINALDRPRQSAQKESTKDQTDWSEVDIEDFVNIAERVDDVEEAWEPPVSLQRGKTGVFDIEELVTMLRAMNAVDIAVIQIPAERDFADYMAIVSGKSMRHLKAMATDLKWTYKRKKGPGDKYLRIEGDDTDWYALDMGNIVVHMFMPEIRELYDLETLWTVGPELDPQCREEEDPYIFTEDELPWLKELENSRSHHGDEHSRKVERKLTDGLK